MKNKIGCIRRNALVPIHTITSFDDFNEYLFEWCGNDAERLHYVNIFMSPSRTAGAM